MKKIYTIIILVSFCTVLFAQQNTIDENTGLTKLLNDFEMYGGLTSDKGLNLDDDYKKQFRNLFMDPDSPVIPGDILSRAPADLFLTVSRYLELVELEFNDGFDHKIDVISIDAPFSFNKEDDIKDIRFRRHLEGLFSSVSANNSEKKIVRKSTKNYQMLVKKKNRRDYEIVRIYDPEHYVNIQGLHLGIFVSPSLVSLSSTGFYNEFYQGEQDFWSEEGEYTKINGGIEFAYYSLNPALNFGFRIMNSNYESKTTIGEFTHVPVKLIDIHGDEYDLKMSIAKEFNESILLKYLEIPVFYKYRHEFLQKRNINHWYLNIGPSIGINYSTTNSSNTITGTIKGNYFNYDKHKIIDDIEDIPPLGFVTNAELGKIDSKSGLKSLIFSAFVESGINFVLKKPKMSFDLGIIYQHGLSDLSAKDNYSTYNMIQDQGVFNSTFDSRESIKTSFIGVILNLKYKYR